MMTSNVLIKMQQSYLLCKTFYVQVTCGQFSWNDPNKLWKEIKKLKMSKHGKHWCIKLHVWPLFLWQNLELQNFSEILKLFLRLLKSQLCKKRNEICDCLREIRFNAWPLINCRKVISWETRMGKSSHFRRTLFLINSLTTMNKKDCLVENFVQKMLTRNVD